MSPHKINGKINMCPKASAGCIAACLNTAGRGKFTNVQSARRSKADFFVRERAAFLSQLHKELLDFSRYARLRGKLPAVRLNGTSDVVWETLIDMSLYPEIQFYDYTKYLVRRGAKGVANYHLTYSRKETDSEENLKLAMMEGMNVAVVFDELPETYMGYEVIDGDKTDLRFLDPTDVIVGLTAKGAAKKDTSGFVIHQQKA